MHPFPKPNLQGESSSQITLHQTTETAIPNLTPQIPMCEDKKKCTSIKSYQVLGYHVQIKAKEDARIPLCIHSTQE